MAKQGRCDECRRIYQWPTNTPMQNAQCPIHKTPLIRCVVTRKWATVAILNVTNSEVERVPHKHRQPKSDYGLATAMGEKVGPGTD